MLKRYAARGAASSLIIHATPAAPADAIGLGETSAAHYTTAVFAALEPPSDQPRRRARARPWPPGRRCATSRVRAHDMLWLGRVRARPRSGGRGVFDGRQ